MSQSDVLLDILSAGLQIPRPLSDVSLRQGVKSAFVQGALTDVQRRELTLGLAKPLLTLNHVDEACDDNELVPNVVGINHSGPLDLELRWESTPDELRLVGWTFDAGGGQVNVAKVFAAFDRPIALTAISGKRDEPTTEAWIQSLPRNFVAVSLVTTDSAKRVNVQNNVDGMAMDLMIGWGHPLSQQVFDQLVQESVRALEQKDVAWALITVGGGIRYSVELNPYRDIVEAAHEREKEVLIDFKWTATRAEILSVLTVARPQAMDILTPNYQEFCLILKACGLETPNEFHRGIIPELPKYARSIMEWFNLRGLLITLDCDGMVFIDHGRTIHCPGIQVDVKSDLGAGDAAKAGFLMGLMSGADMEKVIEQANIFGAVTATLPGTEVISRLTLDSFMKHRGLDSSLCALKSKEKTP